MKLSQTLKERMIAKILDGKFSECDAAIDVRKKDLATDIYNSFPYIEQVKKVPAKWLPIRNSIRCSFAGWSVYYYLPTELPMPYNLAEYRQDFASDNHFTLRFKLIEEDSGVLEQNRKELKRELVRVLASVNTDKQLLAIWPEAIQWLPTEANRNLPAIQSVDHLKELLAK